MIEVSLNPERKAEYYRKGYWTTDTLLDVWNARAQALASEQFVTNQDGISLTYGQIDAKATRLAALLSQKGVVEGDVVTFQLPIWNEFIVALAACLKIGAVMHPVSMRFEGDDLARITGIVESAALLGVRSYRHHDYMKRARCALSQTASIRAHFVFEDESWNDAAEEGSETRSACTNLQPPTQTNADNVALILSTSGTTGVSKQVLLTHNNLLFSERTFIKGLGLTKDDVMFMPAPLNHATGFNHGIIAPLILGGRTVIQERFEPTEALDIINREGVTWSMGATPFIYDILNAAENTGNIPRTMRFYLCGGAPVPSRLIQRASKAGIDVCEVYGSTESCPHVFVPPAKTRFWDGRFSGIPFEGVEVKVVDDTRRSVPYGTQGEEASRGPHVFVGYLNNPASTKRALDDEGWFYSGDLCTQDAQGRIRINGRIKDIIIRGGENISAIEVDEALIDCPGIIDHACAGYPDDRFGERIGLCAVVEPGANLTLEAIKAYLKAAGVPKRLWPERLVMVDRIPRTESGKVRRPLLRDFFKADDGNAKR
ncbi:AMP-binding protein [Eggerthellaceae bacterium zg-1084]|uniref:AMP-binding protein n=1 Tax=Berryella wangjianweii TaxID=2734634 RepID=UPI0015550EF7|nr:AMP-binding protein [Berryella wangjianweii]NPD31533.1 AMP-binding protein [Berryella wangjianweii]NPD32972.1 AMP-binding protein [Eggerthellaceae bacterium zg-997]